MKPLPPRLKHDRLALSIARAVMRRLPAVISRDDVEQAARIGLWKALQADTAGYTPEQQRAYISRRIRGSIIDELRRQDWAPRRQRCKAITPSVVRFDDIPHPEGRPVEFASEGPSPEDRTVLAFDVRHALEAPLDPTDREALLRVFFRGQEQAVVATALGISEARVSQRITRALNTLRAWFEGSVPFDFRNTTVSRHAHEKILEAHAERQHRHDRPPHRAARDHSRAAPTQKPHGGAVRAARLGRPPAARADRPVPGGARAAELAGAPEPGVHAPHARGALDVTPQQKGIVVGNAQRVAARLRSDVARLRAQGFDALQIAAELELDRATVEQVLTEPAPLRKCKAR